MTISTTTIKFLGKKTTLYRVFNNGELVRVCETMEEAEAFIRG